MVRIRLKNKKLLPTSPKELVPLKCIKAFSGEDILTFMADPDNHPPTVMKQIRIEIGNHMDVPYNCIRLTTMWPEYEVEIPTIVEVTLVAESNPDEDELYQECGICFICFDPCKCESDLSTFEPPGFWPTRETNCVRCHPCCICMRCRVIVGDEPVCFACLEPNEVVNLTPEKGLRYTLTGWSEASTWTPSTWTPANYEELPQQME